MERDPSLLNFGVDRHVLLATPTTLIALLFAVAYGWRERELAQNAEEIREIGSALYKNLLTMHGRVERLGSALGTAVNAYNEAVTSLDGRVLTNARKLHELKAGTGEEIERLDTLDLQTRAVNAADWVSPSGDCPVNHQPISSITLQLIVNLFGDGDWCIQSKRNSSFHRHDCRLATRRRCDAGSGRTAARRSDGRTFAAACDGTDDCAQVRRLRQSSRRCPRCSNHPSFPKGWSEREQFVRRSC